MVKFFMIFKCNYCDLSFFVKQYLNSHIEINSLKRKGVFFSESAIRFSNLQKQSIPKNYPEFEI